MIESWHEKYSSHFPVQKYPASIYTVTEKAAWKAVLYESQNARSRVVV